MMHRHAAIGFCGLRRRRPVGLAEQHTLNNEAQDGRERGRDAVVYDGQVGLATPGVAAPTSSSDKRD